MFKLNLLFSFLFFTFLTLTSCSTNTPIDQFYQRSIASKSDQSCSSIIQPFFQKTRHNVQITTPKFTEYYDDLNDTLSGNLATVFRSEWKAKEDYDLGSKYLADFLNVFGGESLVKEFSHLRGKEFIDRTVDRLREIKKIGKVAMRDPPAPIGSNDRTFTYYTKALTDGTGAKHQVRLRTYLREIEPDKMEIGISIPGYLNDKYIEVTKTGANQYKFIMASSFNPETKVYSSDMVEQAVSIEELKKRVNNKLTFYAYPHAKNFKLEIKTRPHDEVDNSIFQKLLGKNYVQKLSVDISPKDIYLLFKDNKIINQSAMRIKLDQLKDRAGRNPKNAVDRTNAIFNLLIDANELDPDFFVAQGATEYKRHAFELELPDQLDGVPVRIQTTFDFDMGVRQNYDNSGNFLDPIDSLQNPLLKPKSEQEQLHIELKIPKVLVEKTVKEKVSASLTSILKIFNSHQVTNKGKFKHISNQADILE